MTWIDPKLTPPIGMEIDDDIESPHYIILYKFRGNPRLVVAQMWKKFEDDRYEDRYKKGDLYFYAPGTHGHHQSFPISDMICYAELPTPEEIMKQLT